MWMCYTQQFSTSTPLWMLAFDNCVLKTTSERFMWFISYVQLTAEQRVKIKQTIWYWRYNRRRFHKWSLCIQWSTYNVVMKPRSQTTLVNRWETCPGTTRKKKRVQIIIFYTRQRKTKYVYADNNYFAHARDYWRDYLIIKFVRVPFIIQKILLNF